MEDHGIISTCKELGSLDSELFVLNFFNFFVYKVSTSAIYSFMASSLLLPAYPAHASCFCRATRLNREGRAPVQSPTVACLKRPYNCPLTSFEETGVCLAFSAAASKSSCNAILILYLSVLREKQVWLEFNSIQLQGKGRVQKEKGKDRKKKDPWAELLLTPHRWRRAPLALLSLSFLPTWHEFRNLWESYLS